MKGSSKKAEDSYNVEVTKAKEIKDGVVAFDMTVNDVSIYGCFYREYTTKDGKDGTLISFPSYKGTNGKYYSYAWFPISKEIKESIIDQLEKLV